ncbi:MAG TPA: winged helix-turn-helix domain-containing protein [archaeon]|nr:winged helix-turn-helix domain-containing protein [archaeon]
MYDLRIFSKNVMYFLAATRGGPTRAKIMREIILRPMNANKLAQKLGVDYKTIVHHVGILRKNNWVIGSSPGYGEVYSCAFSTDQKVVFEQILSKLGKDF